MPFSIHIQHFIPKKKWQKVTLSCCSGFFLLLFLIYQYNFLWLLGEMPSNDELKKFQLPLASNVYTEDSLLIGRYYEQNRDYTGWDEIPELFKKGLVAVEDARFYQHSGVDWKANAAILWYLIKGDKRGSSTITQQLVKNIFDTRNAKKNGLLGKIPGVRMLAVKMKEWKIASQLEAQYTKEQILHLYINAVDFGGNHFGLKTASAYFFGKEPAMLSPSECAILIGVLKASTTYHPILHPDRCKQRRDVVLELFLQHQLISRDEYTMLRKEKIVTGNMAESYTDPTLIYIKLEAERQLQIWCNEHKKNLYTDGLTIYTTINSTLQTYAKEAVKEHMIHMQRKFFKHWEGENPWRDRHKEEIPHFLEDAMKKTNVYRTLKAKYGGDTAAIRKSLNTPHKMTIFTWDEPKDTVMSSYDSLRYYKMFLHAGFVSINPHTGDIKAWVGNNDYRYFMLDHVNHSQRQPGSTFKPFIYCTALLNGLTPCDTLRDKTIVYRYEEEGEIKTWIPRNADRFHSNKAMTLRFAMGRSINSIAAQLSIRFTADSVMALARRLGIQSPLKPVPSAGLGSNEVNLLELTSSYSAFMNEGVTSSPILIKTIYDRAHQPLAFFKGEHRRVLSPEIAWTMSYMLRGTLEEPYGTSQALFQHGTITHRNHIGGKTGTSSNYADGWYVGVTKDLITGVWVGAEDQSIHFRTSTLGEGMKTALPVFGKYIQKVYDDKTSGISKSYFDPSPKTITTPNCKTKVEIIPYEERTDSLKLDSIRFYIDWPKVDSLDIEGSH